jgi:large subunit ribosomal protein L35
LVLRLLKPFFITAGRGIALAVIFIKHLYKDTKMPKLKTKSSCKKRFRFTATGKVIAGQAGKRHGMRKRTNRFIRNARGTTIMDESDQHRIVQYMPYGAK